MRPDNSDARTQPTRRIAAVLTLWLASVGPAAVADAVDFSRDVLPILSDRCFRCHGPDAKARKAGLRLDLEKDALRAENAVILPGNGGESEVVARVSSTDPDEVMPPPGSGKPLTPAEVGVLRSWIDGGARWGRHWAFEPIRRPEPPTVRNSEWARNPIDRFILARLVAEGLRPSPEAGRESLIRRVTLDLTGLPPSLAEVDAFVGDRSPDAFEKVVDRLLASPHYGERMAWDWLEAARYADSNGYQGDNDRTMWPWRDWVVEALNRDTPFDAFTVRQLAGDLLPNATQADALSTAFLRNHMINGEGGRIAEENRVDYVMDMTETLGTVWLGLTLNCCRCHDHKFDPLTQRDYYSLFAFFNQTPVTGGGGDPQTPPVVEAASPVQIARLAEARALADRTASEVERLEQTLFPRPDGQPASASERAKGLPGSVAKALAVAPRSRNRDQVAAIEANAREIDSTYVKKLQANREAVVARDDLVRSLPRVMVMADLPKPRPTFVLTRGSYEKPAAEVIPAVPASMPAMPTSGVRNRLSLARWVVDRENPLTARVTVNRAWQQFFGQGLVKTPEDFGVQGEQPSHPALLDWLADEFASTGWSLKALHRWIVTSATYRQSSKLDPGLAERDPRNRLLARGPRFRMASWMIRDQALAASGLLSRKSGGPGVRIYQPEGVWEDATFGMKKYQHDHGEALYRRSLYSFWRRIVGPTAFFDAATRQSCVVKPTRTNSPMHALTTLNDVTYVEAARALAQRSLEDRGDPVVNAFRLVLARSPSAQEQGLLRASFDRVKREFRADPSAAKKLLCVGESPRDPTIDPIEHAAMTAVCSAILNLDEALTKE